MTEIFLERSQKPKVSILLPNLNNHRFLEERLQTIFNQTFTDWELVVVDSYSDDGAWELIQAFAKKEPRMRIYQAQREGVYAGINRCLELARGNYIYIATSDDTMTSDCLTKMVNALDNHTECDLCHCCLKIIDENGEERKDDWHSLLPAQFFGQYLEQEHIRFAPHDAILYCCLKAVYSSLTQLLIRKTVFDKVGLFKTEFGSQGDIEWGLRATFICNTVHLPYYLATWRRHPNQATQDSFISSSEGHKRLADMVESAFNYYKIIISDNRIKIPFNDLTFCYQLEYLKTVFREQTSFLDKLNVVINFLPVRLDVVLKCVFLYLTKKKFNCLKYAKKLIQKQGMTNSIKIVTRDLKDKPETLVV